MMAVSFSHKIFQDPIEMTYYESAPTNFTLGILDLLMLEEFEFEIRKNLQFISERLKDLSFNANISFIESRLTFSESEKPEEKVVKELERLLVITEHFKGKPLFIKFRCKLFQSRKRNTNWSIL